VPRALLIARNEICYNPRLLKAADCLIDRGYDVFVFDAVLGLAEESLYRDVVASRKWTVAGADLSKRTLASRAAWLYAGIVNRIASEMWRRTALKSAFPIVLNRALVRFPWPDEHFDLIVVNLVDNLPFAAEMKRRNGGCLIYDSQEFFSGQFADTTAAQREWNQAAERDYLADADVILTTTQAMADRLRERFRPRQPVLRVRNAPLDPPNRTPADAPADSAQLRLIWHGFAINYTGRGIDLILEALARCRTQPHLTLQGRSSESQRQLIGSHCERLGIADRVAFAPPAHPEQIVPSLVGYDVGVIAETGLDENQQVTSSNKLFEYIHAGLALVAPDLPGLVETVAAEKVGLIYKTGDANELAAAIDRVATEPALLRESRRRSAAAAQSITWRNDFAQVWTALAGEAAA
jgi:glycosyltransferase involved in cell wall biosynthesis